MKLALEQAQLAFDLGEVPVGAVLADASGEILSKSHNLVESKQDATAHAEILALRSASEILSNWRLSNCILCVTLEPCAMCAGAIRLSRVGTIVYAAEDPRLGAVGSLFNLAEDSRLGTIPRVIHGICRQESLGLLQSFFSRLRRS